MDKNKKILVVYGGPSSEAEVSARTAKAVIKALQRLGYNAELIEYSANFTSDLQQAKPDIVYNAMHGAFGEDGTVQGLLESMRIKYTHSGIKASAIAMDKVLTKYIVGANGVNLANGRIVAREELLSGSIAGPCVIKPVADGSSVGVVVLKQGDRPQADIIGSNKLFLVEDLIKGRELSVAVLNGAAIGAVEILPKSGVYDYTSKYTAGATEYIVPASIPKNIQATAFEYAEKAHDLLGCRGVTRSDMIYDEADGKVYFLEINTHPGMTETSLVPKIAGAQNISFEALVADILSTASLEIMPEK